jgi:hypothetical protein
MVSIKQRSFAIIVAISLALISGCSVNYSFTGASIPIQAKTFSIKTFVNMAPTVNPQLSSLLTEKLYDQIMSSTSLVAEKFDTDMAFEGTITGYHVAPVALQGGDQTVAAKNRLTISIKVKFQSRYQPEASFDTNFSQYEDFDSGMDLTAVEQGLTEAIVEKLVSDIFNKALVNW